jgi:hypothetical protein
MRQRKRKEGHMAKLNQIIAIEKGVKAQTYSNVTAVNKAVQKPELFNGFAKTYQKRDDEGEDLPAERKRVQFTSANVLQTVALTVGELMDLTARKDFTNCEAKAAVEVDGKELLPAAPVSYLLFLEKQLTDLRTLIGNMPVLDEAEAWTKDNEAGLYKTDEVRTHHTKKVQKPLVLYPATPEHPAQTQIITEDVIVYAGFCVQVKTSGALPKPEQTALLVRVEKLLHAVKQAREKANMTDEVTTPKVGEALFGYIMEG